MKCIFICLLVCCIHIPGYASNDEETYLVYMESLINSSASFRNTTEKFLSEGSMEAARAKNIEQSLGAIALNEEALEIYLNKARNDVAKRSLTEIDMNRCLKYAGGIRKFVNNITDRQGLGSVAIVKAKADELEVQNRKFAESMSQAARQASDANK